MPHFQCVLFSKTWDAPALIQIPEGKDMVMPGEDATIEFRCEKKMVDIH